MEDELAAIRVRLDDLLSPPETTERRRGCQNEGCWHDLAPCQECCNSYPERVTNAIRVKREFARHAASDIMLLLPVVETLLASGGEAALQALAAELDLRNRREEIGMPLPRYA